MLKLYTEIDVTGSSLLPIAPSIHSGVASGNHFSADVCLSDEDEDYVRDLSSDESEDDDEGEIPDSDSSEAEMDSPAIAVSPVASSLHIREQFPQQGG